MKVLLISTAVFPVPPERYGGVEVLVNEFCGELVNLGVEVSLAAPKGSSPPKGCELIETVDLHFHKGFGVPEQVAYYNYAHLLREFDVVHDFSHGKYASFGNPILPSLNICWFEPVWFTEQRGGQPHPMPHNVVALSRYQADRFRLVYGRQARHQPTICRDSNVYRPGKRRGRFLFVGKMSWHKGCLEAIKYCRELGVPLDICGGFGVGDPPYYMNTVLNECSGEQVCFYPNVLDEVKVRLMRHARAVLYPVQFTESHNMVLVESMLCGTPVVTFNKGAMNEVVEHGVTGYVANSDNEFKDFMVKVDELDPKEIRKKALEHFSRKVVVKNYLELYRQVAEGIRW